MHKIMNFLLKCLIVLALLIGVAFVSLLIFAIITFGKFAYIILIAFCIIVSITNLFLN